MLFAIWGYAVQIYADFSGYTDIAIGLALLMGFRFPVNFRRPYTAIDLQDFWRRWHITLSFWLRDYLYIPLGGNRGTEWRISVNILITMLLGGLWHGASWTFVFWGAYHGVGQVIGRRRRPARVAAGLPAEPEGRARVAWARFVTFQVVCLGWLFFRADTLGNAFAMLSRLVTGWGCRRRWSRRWPPWPSPRASPASTCPTTGSNRGLRVLRRPPPGGPGRHTGPGAPGHHHPRTAGRGPLHLLPVLTALTMPTTDQPATGRPDPRRPIRPPRVGRRSAHAVGPRPAGPRRPATTAAPAGHDGYGDHAFWERLPFRGVPWTRALLHRPGLLRPVVPARRARASNGRPRSRRSGPAGPSRST